MSAAPPKPPSAVAPPSAAVEPPFDPSPLSRDLSDFEFALITLMFGFHKWAENCMDAADVRGLSALDILVLHAVNHRARSRRLTEVCMVLNVDDNHLVAYSLKKLMAAELAVATLHGRERHYETTPRGEQACLAYRRVREEFLVPTVEWIAHGERRVRDTADFMRAMSAMYAQAGRSATAATAGLPKSPPVHTKR